jgi:hypothetical protein
MKHDTNCKSTKSSSEKMLNWKGFLTTVAITFAPITIATQANAGTLTPISYDMLNGETGSYTYHDDSYSGLGNKTTDLASLTGGVGDLTDGVIATSSWYVTPSLYVGWETINPTITFHFANDVQINSLTLYSDSYFSVSKPSSVAISMGGSSFNSGFLADSSGPGSYTFSGLDFTGKDLSLTLNSRGGWVMASEVTFDGTTAVPEPLTILGAGTAIGFGTFFGSTELVL